MEKINLSQLTQYTKVISGRDRGIELRAKLKIDEKDNDEEIYEFEIAQNVYSFNSSCFLGLFSDSIKKLGEKNQNINENLDVLYGEIIEKKPQLMNTLYKYGLDIIK